MDETRMQNGTGTHKTKASRVRFETLDTRHLEESKGPVNLIESRFTSRQLGTESNRIGSCLGIESNLNQMPVMDGHDATKAIRVANASIPIVGVTGPNLNTKPQC
jgi:hypothetical protein